jgi:hypothetical protein
MFFNLPFKRKDGTPSLYYKSVQHHLSTLNIPNGYYMCLVKPQPIYVDECIPIVPVDHSMRIIFKTVGNKYPPCDCICLSTGADHTDQCYLAISDTEDYDMRILFKKFNPYPESDTEDRD